MIQGEIKRDVLQTAAQPSTNWDRIAILKKFLPESREVSEAKQALERQVEVLAPPKPQKKGKRSQESEA